MKGKCKQPIGKEATLGVEAAPGPTLPEHKLNEIKIDSIKSDFKIKVEPKIENVETYV